MWEISYVMDNTRNLNRIYPAGKQVDTSKAFPSIHVLIRRTDIPLNEKNKVQNSITVLIFIFKNKQ